MIYDINIILIHRAPSLSLSPIARARVCGSSIDMCALCMRVRICVSRALRCIRRTCTYVRTIFERARRRNRDDTRTYQRTIQRKRERERETEESREKRTNDRAEN